MLSLYNSLLFVIVSLLSVSVCWCLTRQQNQKVGTFFEFLIRQAQMVCLHCPRMRNLIRIS